MWKLLSGSNRNTEKRKSWNQTGLACWLAEFMSPVKNTNERKKWKIEDNVINLIHRLLHWELGNKIKFWIPIMVSTSQKRISLPSASLFKINRNTVGGMGVLWSSYLVCSRPDRTMWTSSPLWPLGIILNATGIGYRQTFENGWVSLSSVRISNTIYGGLKFKKLGLAHSDYNNIKWSLKISPANHRSPVMQWYCQAGYPTGPHLTWGMEHVRLFWRATTQVTVTKSLTPSWSSQ